MEPSHFPSIRPDLLVFLVDRSYILDLIVSHPCSPLVWLYPMLPLLLLRILSLVSVLSMLLSFLLVLLLLYRYASRLLVLLLQRLLVL